MHGTVHGIERDHQIDVLRDHLLRRPVVHGDAAYAAPRHVGPLQAIDHPHHVVRAAGCLPVEKLLAGHVSIEPEGRAGVHPADWLPPDAALAWGAAKRTIFITTESTL